MPVSAVDSVSPAFEHAKQQLFRPFRFGQWTRLAFVGFLAGELSSGGGCNFQFPNTTAPSQHRNLFAPPHLDPALLAPMIVIALIVVPILWLALTYISSRMRFVLFDSVIARRCEIGRMWSERGGQAMQYFIWNIVFGLITLAGTVVLIGVPALFAFLLGWFSAPRQHLLGLILTGIGVFFVFAAWLVLSIVVHVFTKDFVVPQMALEGVSAFDGWRRLLAMMQSEKGRYAGYAGMKIILAIGAAFLVGIATFVLLLLLLIPFGGIGVASVLAGKAAGLGWNVFTITAAVVAGCVFLAVVLYGIALVSVPVFVFFPAYSIYFFSGRYPQLARLIYPEPPPLPAPPAPPIAPEPNPAM